MIRFTPLNCKKYVIFNLFLFAFLLGFPQASLAIEQGNQPVNPLNPYQEVEPTFSTDTSAEVSPSTHVSKHTDTSSSTADEKEVPVKKEQKPIPSEEPKEKKKSSYLNKEKINALLEKNQRENEQTLPHPPTPTGPLPDLIVPTAHGEMLSSLSGTLIFGHKNPKGT